MLNYQELTYPAGFIKMRCGENHDTPRLAHWVQDEWRLRHWLAFLYFCRGSMLLYGGTEFAPQHQVGLFDAEDNFGDKRGRLTGLPAPLQGYEGISAAGRGGVVRGQRRRCRRALQVPGRGAHRRI